MFDVRNLKFGGVLRQRELDETVGIVSLYQTNYQVSGPVPLQMKTQKETQRTTDGGKLL